MKILFLTWFSLLALNTAQAQTPASPKRLDEVTQRGRQVMPFNLEQTQHVFNKTAHGGIQQVVAKQQTDALQIQLIRQHLSAISQAFQRGDFTAQRQIHGNDMPGLADMQQAYAQIAFVYRELPNGAEIEYSSEASVLVDAIHRYFNAQLSDHAGHAHTSDPEHCEHHSSTTVQTKE